MAAGNPGLPVLRALIALSYAELIEKALSTARELGLPNVERRAVALLA